MNESARLAFQVAIIVLAARGLGRIAECWLKQPSVIGELLAGVIIGPYALGGLSLPPLQLWGLALPGIAPLFSVSGGGGSFEGPVLHGFTVLAGAVLLFRGGLETDLRSFLRYAPAGLLIGLGGAALSFALGILAAVRFLGAEGPWSTRALMMGTVATATSVGLTVRVLSERRKIDTPEGSAVLSAAVIDDVIGLVFLSVVIAMGGAGAPDGSGAGQLLRTAGAIVLKAVVLWGILLGGGWLLRRPLAKLLKRLGGRTSAASFALALAVLAGGLAEASGMAMIVGAYIAGLTLGSTDMKHEIDRGVGAIHDFLVPILFCVTGMMVNLSAAAGALLPGLAFAGACVAGKVLGCGLPALAAGFNLKGALRVGVGMLPRQEVGLIVAGLAFSRGLLDSSDMNAVVIMVLLTTLATPWLVSRLFGESSGRRRPVAQANARMLLMHVPVPEPALGALIVDRLLHRLRREGFYSYRIPGEIPAYELRRGEDNLLLRAGARAVEMTAGPGDAEPAREVIRETMAELARLAQEIADIPRPAAMASRDDPPDNQAS